MKRILGLLLLIFLTSCGGGDTVNGDPEVKMGRVIVPSESEAKELVAEYIEYFHQGVKAGEMSVLHQHLGVQFQKDFDEESLKESFQGFFDRREAYLDFVGTHEFSAENIVFDTPLSVNDAFDILLQGHFETTPQLNFEMILVFQQETWKLEAINLTLE